MKLTATNKPRPSVRPALVVTLVALGLFKIDSQPINQLTQPFAGLRAGSVQTLAGVGVDARSQGDARGGRVATRAVGGACPPISRGLIPQRPQRTTRGQLDSAIAGIDADMPSGLCVCDYRVGVDGAPGQPRSLADGQVQIVCRSKSTVVPRAVGAGVIDVACHVLAPLRQVVDGAHSSPAAEWDISYLDRRQVSSLSDLLAGLNQSPDDVVAVDGIGASLSYQGGKAGALATGGHNLLGSGNGAIQGDLGAVVEAEGRAHGFDLRTCLAPVLARDGQSMTYAMRKSITIFNPGFTGVLECES